MSRDPLLHNAELWERRMTSGQGALQTERIDPEYEPMLCMVAGPIKHWWDENWMSPAHVRYDEWRTLVSETIVAAGHLVYRPHEAFKGHWTESAQAINDAVVGACDVFIDLTPDSVPAEGTAVERAIAVRYRKLIIEAPPPLDVVDDDAALGRLLRHLSVVT